MNRSDIPIDLESEPAQLSCASYDIRTATIDDAPVIAHHRASMFLDMGVIDKAAAASLELASHSYLLKAIPAEEYLGWIIESENVAVAGGGMIIRQLLPRPGHLEGGSEAHILNIYTEPPHRRCGLARKLMTSMLSWCRQQGIYRITLHASDAGKPLYESLGFIQTNEMRFEIGS
jgi:GNAT superfamily N-acetyltransferase